MSTLASNVSLPNFHNFSNSQIHSYVGEGTETPFGKALQVSSLLALPPNNDLPLLGVARHRKVLFGRF